MRLLTIIPVVLVLSAYCHGITMAPEPTFEQMVKASKLIGIVKVLTVPEEPKNGFSEQDPPLVSVSITTSFRGLEKGTHLGLQWSSGIRLDKIASYSSFMPIAKPSEIKIAPPSLGEEYFVFLEEPQKDLSRDIYGWNKRRLVQLLPEIYEEEIWPWSWVVLKSSPLVRIPRAKSSYNRRRYVYETLPKNDYRVREAIWAFEVEDQGAYWILTSETAVLVQFSSRKANADWPLSHVVTDGDTLFGIAEKYYGSGSSWQNILEANKSLISDPQRLKPGIELTIPPEKESYPK